VRSPRHFAGALGAGDDDALAPLLWALQRAATSALRVFTVP